MLQVEATEALPSERFQLDDERNDTSLVLDLVRVAAAQVVCVGHALNIFVSPGTSFWPHVGVMLFFLLSGFVIAHTLRSKTERPGYQLGEFCIERFARIYAAYLPALVFIAALDALMRWLGKPIAFGDGAVGDFVRSLFLLQGYPGPFSLGGPTFGSGGHLTSLAVEFHIYFFVGALFFLLLGRQRGIALCVAAVFSAMPLGYFIELTGSDRALFVLWLLGFGAYFAARATRIDRTAVRIAIVCCGVALLFWLHKRVPGSEYAINHYPLLCLAFLALVIATQGSRDIARSMLAQKTIRFAASYSFTLFLVHYSIEKALKTLWSGSPWLGVVVAVVVANLFAIGFASVTEFRYHALSAWLKVRLIRPTQRAAT